MFYYDYQNTQTRGWVRAEFERQPANWNDAFALLQDVARQWANGTTLRLIEVHDEAGTGSAGLLEKPTVSDVVVGSRGPLPKDR